MKATISRKIGFSAAHRLHNSKWPAAKNLAVFGKCNNPNFHGHNYLLEARVKGEIDEETGYVMDAKTLNDILQQEVVDKFDHKNLNLDTDEFRELNPTAENIARRIHELVRLRIGAGHHLTIILYETDRNSVEYSGE
jgi:6-pyruvoyltetrahydropterin/6-carboxytetrahydropterin synthase